MTGLLRRGHLLGSKLRTLRQRHGWTLEELSVRCIQRNPAQAPSVSYLSMLERGKRVPSDDMLERIAAVFGKPAHWFLDGHASLEPNGTLDAAQDSDRLPQEPAFLFSHASLRATIPELLEQTGTSGRRFAELLIRVWQETHQNDFPDIERAAEAAGARQMPLDLKSLIRICEQNSLQIRWVDDDRRKLQRGLLRARFEPPGVILASRRLLSREERLKYELAFYLGHRILHGGDGGISAIGADYAPPAESADSAPLSAHDVLHSWREFECGFFAGALLCPRGPFRQMLLRESHALEIHRKIGVGPAVAMRRMTAVSPYRHWHFFDAYAPGYLRTVYRGNRVPLPWGNLSPLPDPCPHWAVFRLLRSIEPDAVRLARAPKSQISVMLDRGQIRIFCCHSLVTRDATDALRVLSVGVDLAPALIAQNIDAQGASASVWEACHSNRGAAPLPAEAAAAIENIAYVLRIGWIATALANPASIICPRTRQCPRREPCS
jgi:transcriptional regulator with XRE-family HTH domain